MIRVDVAGVPVTQGSKTGFVVKGRVVLVEVNEKQLKPWRQQIAAQAQEAAGGTFFEKDVPIATSIRFRIPKPASAPKRKRTWPIAARSGDLDKLERAVYDALTGVVFKDDSQIVHHDVGKDWADGPSGVTITLWEVKEGDL